MRFLIFLLCVLAFCTESQAQKTLGIKGPFEVLPGELVRLSADIDDNESPFWIVLKPTDLDYEQVENGKRIIFSADCSVRQEIIVLLLAQQIDENGRIITRQLRQTITVGRGPPDDPVDDPEPDTPEDDPVQESEFSKSITDEVKRISPPISVIEAVSNNFDMVANAVGNNVYPDVRSFSTDLSKKNTLSIGQESLPQWQGFGFLIQEEFRRLASSGELSQVPDHKPILHVIANAIRKAGE